jgi:hypothetical protein
MTLDEFTANLKLVGPGKYASVPYVVYADLFPPGEPDEHARGRCHEFARSHGFTIENKPALQAVWFVKNAPRT